MSVEYDLKQLQTAARSERAEGFDPQDPGCSFGMFLIVFFWGVHGQSSY